MKYAFVFVCGYIFCGLMQGPDYSKAADLAVPKPKQPAERCLTPGENPSPGQTLHADKSCKSGMRWIFAR